jgi:hypothetical protein
MTRFYAHFCLFLQMIEVPVPPQAMQTILETYIGILEVSHAYMRPSRAIPLTPSPFPYHPPFFSKQASAS